MAATKQEGRWYGMFLAGLTVTCAGIYEFSSGGGKVALVVGLLILAATFWKFLQMKPLEGKVANGAQPAGMKLVGVLVIILGWLIVLFGLHIASGVGSRMATTIVGMIVSLVGVLGILPAACNKNAIWKA
jgi:Cu/Ag efflux pump CusA